MKIDINKKDASIILYALSTLIQNMNEDKYNIVPIYIAKDKSWYTGHMLRDIETYKNFEDLKRYSKKVVLCKNGEEFILQTVNGFFRKTIATLS